MTYEQHRMYKSLEITRAHLMYTFAAYYFQRNAYGKIYSALLCGGEHFALEYNFLKVVDLLAQCKISKYHMLYTMEKKYDLGTAKQQGHLQNVYAIDTNICQWKI